MLRPPSYWRNIVRVSNVECESYLFLRKVSDWSALINDILKMSDLAATTSYDNTASLGITFVDELHNLNLEKCGKSSCRQRAVRSRRIRGK